MVAPAIIGAAGSILSGLFGRSKPKYVVPDYQQIRDKAEAAGFNPLTALQMAPGAVIDGGGASMGTAIADAAQMLLGGIGAKAEGKLSQAQQENARLKKQVQSLTLRPKFGGVYAEREAVPSGAAAMGVADAPAGSVAASDRGFVPRDRLVGGQPAVTPLGDVEAIDPRRPVDHQPVKTHSGFMVVDNPMGRLEVPTLDGDEAFHWYDYPDLLLPMGKQFFDAQAEKAVSERLRERVYHKPYAPVGGPKSDPEHGVYRAGSPEEYYARMLWLNRYAGNRGGNRRSVSGRDYQRYN